MQEAYVAGPHLSADPDVFVDVMGRPPRVPYFEQVLSSATIMKTPWGDIPTIGIKHLVEVKKTQRLNDYPVIGRLVLRYMDERDSPGASDYQWAVGNVYTVEDLQELLLRYPEAKRFSTKQGIISGFGGEIERHGEAKEETYNAVETFLTERILVAREADRAYWRYIIAELRAMRVSGELVPDGASVLPPGASQ